MPLDTAFFARDPETVARDLLGRHLVHGEAAELRGRIVETEAYHGPDDPASHASSGKTQRNAPMFEEPGKAYIYVSYGIHHMLNVVTGAAGDPSVVLVRAVKPLAGTGRMRERRGVDAGEALCSGPGKLCEAFGITTEHNRVDLTGGALRIEDGKAVEADDTCVDTRIGVSGGEDLELRFYEDGSDYVSR
ncbi:MAG: DNA-3-methyladenine glycosylase [Candidatus Nanohaloarchaea archaeon]|nr:DNA-3-methyladenine glycosylase [Candidatus Nanohaloarchaea archaeon]